MRRATGRSGGHRVARGNRHSRTNSVSIKDIAVAANVSIATVSRVLNQPHLVRPEVRERVQLSLRNLGYVPHAAARALASKRTRSVGVVVPTMTTANFAIGVEAMQNKLSEFGYALLIANSQYDLEKEFWEVKALVERGVDGLILVGNERISETRDFLSQHSTPCVVTYVDKTLDSMPAVGVDNYAGAYSIAQYVLDQGHSKIGIISSPSAFNDRIRARRDGILTCLSDYNFVERRTPVIERPYSIEGGQSAFEALMREHPDTTAIFATTDIMAFGAILAAREMGIAIPGQVSICGFDDIEFCRLTDPPLTTVRVPNVDIGERAAQILYRLVNGETVPKVTSLGAELIIRNSVAAR